MEGEFEVGEQCSLLLLLLCCTLRQKMCVCACVYICLCVCVREREREKWRDCQNVGKTVHKTAVSTVNNG